MLKYTRQVKISMVRPSFPVLMENTLPFFLFLNCDTEHNPGFAYARHPLIRLPAFVKFLNHSINQNMNRWNIISIIFTLDLGHWRKDSA